MEIGKLDGVHDVKALKLATVWHLLWEKVMALALIGLFMVLLNRRLVMTPHVAVALDVLVPEIRY